MSDPSESGHEDGGATGPEYLVLADRLAETIEDLAPGTRLPSENELATDNGVSRITARAALQELERRHVARRTRGAGTFVALRIPYPVRAGMHPSWSHTVTEAGHRASYRVRSIETLRAPARIARELMLPNGRTVVRLTRVGLVDGEPAAHHTIWLPAARVPGLAAHMTSGVAHGSRTHSVDLPPPASSPVESTISLSAVLTEVYGITTKRWTSQVDLAPVPADIGVELDVIGRPPAWRQFSVNVDHDTGVPIESNHAWMRADCFQVQLELGPTDGAGRGRPSDP